MRADDHSTGVVGNKTIINTEKMVQSSIWSGIPAKIIMNSQMKPGEKPAILLCADEWNVASNGWNPVEQRHRNDLLPVHATFQIRHRVVNMEITRENQ
ncbi:hypothetical protein CAEBREN_08832 [Caenorhabditis brenneri]|uniref:Uncharacterized protein n=1 Tax=Caenorhabditis brenneri TaxID=135651 RepID=G0NS26_CAEBE|nr:hypothetical protein CAEBREN_08832 [Caenorhabditis brenneri]